MNERTRQTIRRRGEPASLGKHIGAFLQRVPSMAFEPCEGDGRMQVALSHKGQPKVAVRIHLPVSVGAFDQIAGVAEELGGTARGHGPQGAVRRLDFHALIRRSQDGAATEFLLDTIRRDEEHTPAPNPGIRLDGTVAVGLPESRNEIQGTLLPSSPPQDEAGGREQREGTPYPLLQRHVGRSRRLGAVAWLPRPVRIWVTSGSSPARLPSLVAHLALPLLKQFAAFTTSPAGAVTPLKKAVTAARCLEYRASAGSCQVGGVK